jgi:SAM-dependent methyltransferase
VSAQACGVCGGTDTREFLRREAVPVHQNLVLQTRAQALAVERGDLELTACRACGFVYNAAFDAAKLAYGEDYDNTQSYSPFFARYIAQLARHLVEEEGVRGAAIVEVGCGNGEFLRLLVDDPGYGNTGVGFDPSYVGPDSGLGGRLRFERRAYDAACAKVPADVVVCRHVIEHVSRPLELLRAVRLALAGSRSPRIYFETPCVEWILRNRVIWDFFYEHCSLFTPASLTAAFQRSGFAVRSVRHVFEGQYLWLEAGLAPEAGAVRASAGDIPALGEQFALAEARLRTQWRERVRELGREGKVAIWGAGAKGATFAHLVDPQGSRIDCLVDLNPDKQGRFVPGTGHPIVAPAELATRGVRFAILMNPNYRAENEALLGTLGAAVALIE